MGKSMYDIGNRNKERARQQKQIDKASKRILARQKKVHIKTSLPNAELDIGEPILAVDIVKGRNLPILK